MIANMASSLSKVPVRASSRYVPAAQTAAEIILEVLKSLRGTDPSLIERWVLTETNEGEALLFAVVDDLRVQSYQPWVTALHALSTSLRGRDVFISNTTGFRYAVLLSDRPALPKEILFPGVRKGVVQIGMRSNGRPLNMTWDQLGHVLVASETQFGKSTFLRLLLLQALAEGHRFLLGDVDGRTFSRMKGDQSLMMPIVNNEEGFANLIKMAVGELKRRVRLFEEANWHPDNLSEYNEKASEPLPPVMVMMDEFSSIVLALGGPNSEFAKMATQIAWRGLKFGIRLVLAGQDFSKDIVGPVREQMRTRLCFRVERPSTSDVVIGRRGAERLIYPGRAMMPSGLVQTYLVAKDALGSGDQAKGPQVSEAEKVKIGQMVEQFEGRADLSGIQEVYGMNERAARRIRDDWASRGLIEKRANANNAWFFVQTPWASKPVQTASERTDGVQTSSGFVAARNVGKFLTVNNHLSKGVTE
ncbi:MAG: hypothetical protein C4583_04215 [Anaerolineaceae bacterium]|nr:MAG: hypothetical protein C4583_04215 [Anaerolineaceae bacterium]